MFEATTGTFAANKVLRELGKSGAIGHTERTVIFPTTKLDLVFSDPPGLYVSGTPFLAEIIDGQKYKVVWNGVEYECTAVFVEGLSYVLGNLGLAYPEAPDTGESFALCISPTVVDEYGGSTEGAMIVATSDPAVTLAIYTETIHPIDHKYLPEGGVGYSESWSITWDGNTEGREVFGIPDGETWYHVSDKVLTADDFYGAMATVLIPVDGEPSPQSVLGTSDNVFEAAPGAVTLTGVVYSFAQAGEVDEGLVIPKVGTYFLKAVDGRVTSLSKEEVHPIEPKYIPGVVLPKVTLYEGSAFYGSDPSTLDFPALTEAHNKGVPCVICNNSGGVSVVANHIENGFVMLVGGEVITFTRSSTDEWSTSSRSY